VLIKLDLARAFDSISWSFLFEVLRRMGFGERFLKWIALLLHRKSQSVGKRSARRQDLSWAWAETRRPHISHAVCGSDGDPNGNYEEGRAGKPLW
jgi:hypothetical protein